MKYKIFIFLFCLLFSLSSASAQLQIELNVQDNFNYGEEVYFEYSFSSSENIENLFYTPYIYCEGSPQPLLNQEMISLTSEQSYSQKYIYGFIDDNYYSGKCLASISVEQPYQQNIEKEFTITSKKNLKFEVKTCKDALCKELAKIFEKGDLIYFVYDSDYTLSKETLAISAKIIIPETKAEQEVNLAKIGDSVKSEYIANNIGTYEINVVASANDYKTQNLKYQFGVIEKQEDILFSPILENENFFTKLKNIFLSVFYMLFRRENQILSSPIGPTSSPQINSAELETFKQKYSDLIFPCSKPKNATASSSSTLFNSSILFDNDNATQWISASINSAYLDLTYSGKCNFTKLNINFGIIPIQKKATLTLTCLDNAKIISSYVYNYIISGKSRDFLFAKQNCSKYKINFKWDGNYKNSFYVREILFKKQF